MKKNVLIMLLTLSSVMPLFSMIEQVIVLTPEHFLNDLKNEILLYVTKNTDTLIDNDIKKAINFIRSLSCVNKHYDKQINNPFNTLIIINRLPTTPDTLDRCNLANTLATSGAKNYNVYSKLLHKVKLEEKERNHFITSGGTHQELDNLKKLPFDKQLIEYCINKGGDINYHLSSSESDFTLLKNLLFEYRTKHITIETVELSLQLGAKIENADNKRQDIIDFVISNNMPEIIELLYKYNQKLRDKSRDLLSETALRKAFLEGKYPHYDILKALNYETTLYMAFIERRYSKCDIIANDKIVELLLKNDYTLEEALQKAIFALDKDLVQKFITQGANLRAIDFYACVKYLLINDPQKQKESDILELLAMHGVNTTREIKPWESW